ncbi:MAG: shikimate kinase [Acidimicrobiales bacterium]
MTVSAPAFWHAVAMVNRRPHVAIVGQMGVGKSTLGRALASALDRRHVDGDDELEAGTGRNATGILDELGLAALHEAEAEVFLARLAESEPLVISASASVIESPICRSAMAEHAVVVWIDGSPLDVAVRSAGAAHRRPLDDAEVMAIDTRRRPLYEAAADLVVDNDTGVDVVAERVSPLLEQ